MTNTEYRKAMYRDGAYTSVGNAEEEAEKRAEGWTDWYTDQDRMNGVVKPAEQVVKAALAESMRLDPPPAVTEVIALAPKPPFVAPAAEPKRKPGRPPKAK